MASLRQTTQGENIMKDLSIDTLMGHQFTEQLASRSKAGFGKKRLDMVVEVGGEALYKVWSGCIVVYTSDVLEESIEVYNLTPMK
jgi:hypothetical protein